MRIALLGTRGIPANYGGFETFAEELSVRLAQRGHSVTVYCRTNNSTTDVTGYRGVRRVLLPTISHKYFDTLAHTALSTLHLLFQRVDVALYCNGANAILTAAPRLVGIPTALNVDGLERKRRKWNAPAKAWYLISERLSTWLPNRVVTDAEAIERYYRERYGKETTFIAYGADMRREDSTEALDELGLEPAGYFLYVSRLEPENNADLVVEAFEQARVEQKLVMVGDAPYADAYIKTLKQSRDPRIVFPGAVYGKRYRELQSHCLAYIHATEVGGAHPALIEALGRRALTLYLEVAVFGQVRQIYFPSATATLFRREFFERAGGFDESFFAYLEDVDLGLRAAIADLPGVYVPDARAFHQGSRTGGAWSGPVVTWMTCNQLLLLAKFYPARLLVRFACPILAAQCLWAALAISRGRGLPWIRGVWEGLKRARRIRRAGAGLREGSDRLPPVLMAAEAQIGAIQRSLGWDSYWKWYFRLALPPVPEAAA